VRPSRRFGRFQGRRPTARILALALMLLGAACSGESSPPANRPVPSPQRYVSGVCNAVLEWKTVIEIRSSSLVMQDPSVPSASAYLKGVLADTDQMVAQVHAVGAPTGPNGTGLQRGVVHGLAAARSALLAVQAEVKKLVADSYATLLKEVEVPILLAVEALESELRNPSILEISQATASDADCYRLFRRKAPVGIGA
jgi:hypothetical protein